VPLDQTLASAASTRRAKRCGCCRPLAVERKPRLRAGETPAQATPQAATLAQVQAQAQAQAQAQKRAIGIGWAALVLRRRRPSPP